MRGGVCVGGDLIGGGIFFSVFDWTGHVRLLFLYRTMMMLRITTDICDCLHG